VLAADAENVTADAFAAEAFRDRFEGEVTRSTALRAGVCYWMGMVHLTPRHEANHPPGAIQEVAKLENKLTPAQRGALDDVEGAFSDIYEADWQQSKRCRLHRRASSKTCKLLCRVGL